MRELTEKEVTFTIECEWEDAPVRGGFASGDDVADKALEDQITARLYAGDIWAWCCVVVTARWRGFSGTASLGCCSYVDEKDFKNSDYFNDMRAEALEDLNKEISNFVKSGEFVKARLS